MRKINERHTSAVAPEWTRDFMGSTIGDVEEFAAKCLVVASVLHYVVCVRTMVIYIVSKCKRNVFA